MSFPEPVGYANQFGADFNPSHSQLYTHNYMMGQNSPLTQNSFGGGLQNGSMITGAPMTMRDPKLSNEMNEINGIKMHLMNKKTIDDSNFKVRLVLHIIIMFFLLAFVTFNFASVIYFYNVAADHNRFLTCIRAPNSTFGSTTLC